MNIAPHPLANDPLAFLVFEKFRRVGADRADDQIITHQGIEHRMIAQTIGTIKTVHVVLQTLHGPDAGHQRAMAIVAVHENGYASGPDGLGLVLPALHAGIHVQGAPSSTADYRVLPWLPVPPAFQTTGHDR